MLRYLLIIVATFFILIIIRIVSELPTIVVFLLSMRKIETSECNVFVCLSRYIVAMMQWNEMRFPDFVTRRYVIVLETNYILI